MGTSIITDASDREDAINALLEAATANPLIDNDEMAILFSDMSGYVLIYERAGLTGILDSLQDQIDNNGTHKTFLLSFTDAENTTTVMQAIGSFIQ